MMDYWDILVNIEISSLVLFPTTFALLRTSHVKETVIHSKLNSVDISEVLRADTIF